MHNKNFNITNNIHINALIKLENNKELFDALIWMYAIKAKRDKKFLYYLIGNMFIIEEANDFLVMKIKKIRIEFTKKIMNI